METNKTKQCNTCGEIKDINEFNIGKNYKDGHKNICKKCEKEYKRKLRMKKQNQPTKEYDIDNTYKICTKCGKSKPLKDYNINDNSKYGRLSRCKQCMKEVNRTYNQRRQKLTPEERVAINRYNRIKYKLKKKKEEKNIIYI